MAQGGDFDQAKAIIIVFTMKGCPACEEFKPVLEQEVGRWQANRAPLVWYTGKPVAAGVIPVVMLDVASSDPQVQALADVHKVEGVPSTVLLTRNALPVKREGTMTAPEVYELLASAAYANR